MSERVVVVGAGSISGVWFKALAAEQVTVAAVVDLDTTRAAKRIEEFHLTAEASPNLAKALRKHKPDFVIDLTIPDAHCAVTCKALKMGFPVIGEKPMAATMPQARRMVAASEKAGKLYMVSQSRRWDKNHHLCRQVLEAGQVGKLTTMNCDFYIGAHFGGFRDEMASPLILDMSIHHFDLARMLSGADPVAVYAREFNPAGSWYQGDVAASCVFEMTNGVVFTYCGSWCAEGLHTSWQGDWRFQGVKGSVLYERDQMPRGAVITSDTGFSREKQAFDVPDIEIPGPGQHGALKEFLAAIRGGPAPQGECHDNIKSLAMVFAAIESSRKRRRVPVKWWSSPA